MRLQIFLLASILVMACAKPARVGTFESEPPAASAAADEQAPEGPSRPFDARKLVRTVDLDLRLDDTEAAAEEAQAIATDAGGYVASVNAYRREELLHYQITLKVPVARLDEIVDKIKTLAEEVQREQVRTEDVTDRYVDLEARLRTLGATETELQELLAESRAREYKVEDIMAVYEQLTEIRTRIEQLQAQLNTLANQTTFSTINLDLTPTEAARPLVGDKWRPSATVRSSFRTLLGALQGFADLAIFFVVVLLPVSFLVAVPLWLLAKLWRRVRPRRAREDASPPAPPA